MAKKSSGGNLTSLIILFLVIAVLAAIGWVVYQIVNDVSNQTRQKMEKRNISFTNEGMKVGVKQKTAEEQSDGAQNLIVKMWNASSSGSPATTPGQGTEKRKPFSRSASSQHNVSRTTSHQSAH